MQHICTTACLYYLCFRSSSGLTCNTKDGCHETPKHKPTDSGLTSNQPLQQEEEEEEEFTAGQMDPRLKTAGSFRGRQGEREREDDTSYTERRERERESVGQMRGKAEQCLSLTLQISMWSPAQSCRSILLLCAQQMAQDTEREEARERRKQEEASRSSCSFFSFFFSFIHILQPAVATKTHQETRQRNLLCFPSLYTNCTVNQSFIKKMPTESVKHLQ